MPKRTALLLAIAVVVARPVASQQRTDVAILGVAHSAMLVAESYQPAVFRAYMERVNPDAICIERAPEEVARGSHYEFTYEIQHIAVPYAQERGIALCPFDWLPDIDDQVLAFGINLEELPFLRGPQSYAQFQTFSDSAALRRDLFYAESDAEREQHRQWYEEVPDQPRFDFARRLFLYRTFLQGMRISRAARAHPGGRVLVIVGSMHKDDLERILQGENHIRIVPPPQYGAPTAEEIGRHVNVDDLAAIATFNLLGLQSAAAVNWAWLERVVARLEQDRRGPETRLLRTRLDVLTRKSQPAQAAEQYRSIAGDSAAATRFVWDGVLDRRRLDSFADPFANLTVAQRALLEQARELTKAGSDAGALLTRLEEALPALRRAQLRAYWELYGAGRR